MSAQVRASSAAGTINIWTSVRGGLGTRFFIRQVPSELPTERQSRYFTPHPCPSLPRWPPRRLPYRGLLPGAVVVPFDGCLIASRATVPGSVQRLHPHCWRVAKSKRPSGRSTLPTRLTGTRPHGIANASPSRRRRTFEKPSMCSIPGEAVDRDEIARGNLPREFLEVITPNACPLVYGDLREGGSGGLEGPPDLFVLGRLEIPGPHREDPGVVGLDDHSLVREVAKQRGAEHHDAVAGRDEPRRANGLAGPRAALHESQRVHSARGSRSRFMLDVTTARTLGHPSRGKLSRSAERRSSTSMVYRSRTSVRSARLQAR